MQRIKVGRLQNVHSVDSVLALPLALVPRNLGAHGRLKHCSAVTSLGLRPEPQHIIVLTRPLSGDAGHEAADALRCAVREPFAVSSRAALLLAFAHARNLHLPRRCCFSA